MSCKNDRLYHAGYRRNLVKHSTVHGVIEQPGMFPIAENGTAEQITQTIITYLKKYPAKKIAISMPGPADFKRESC